MNDEAKCACLYCGEHIAFPIEAAGQKIECPHCQCETLLSTPSAELNQIVSCPCQHCRGEMGFDASGLVEENSLVQCPHCGLETKLFIPAQDATEKSADAAPGSNEVKPNLDEPKAKLKEITNRMEIRFKQDTLELCDDIVKITRRGFLNALNTGMNGTRTILISSITAVQMKPGSTWTGGYILFSYAGSKPFMGGLLDAINDPDAFLFNDSLNEQVAEFKTRVEQKMRELKQPAPVNNSSGTLTDELRKLAEFKNQGILTQAEFDAAKKKLLG